MATAEMKQSSASRLQGMGTRIFGVMQKLGKALMLPVAVLPVAGILLGVGGAVLNGAETNSWHLPFTLQVLLQIMRDSGDPIFAALPLIFAIGVALGLTKNDGVAALAATIGFLVMTATLGVIGTNFGMITPLDPHLPAISQHAPFTILGLPTISTGVFGGILIGAVSGILFNRYYRISLPPYLGFFAGKRFVPIVTAFAAIGLGIVLSIVWPPIQKLISAFGHWASEGSTPVAVWIYGTVERLLLPFGLHHIWNAPFSTSWGSASKTTAPGPQAGLPAFFTANRRTGCSQGAFW